MRGSHLSLAFVICAGLVALVALSNYRVRKEIVDFVTDLVPGQTIFS